MNDCVEITLKEWRSTSFEWGKRDCMLSIAEYLILRDGIDHGAALRGTYNTEAGALAALREAGGQCAMFDAAGLVRVSGQPSRGDVVLIEYPGVPLAGICTGDSVAFRLERGVAEINTRFVRILHIWR